MFTALRKLLFPEKACYFRLGFVAAREGHIAEILCSIHETQETPMPAVLVQVLIMYLTHIFILRAIIFERGSFIYFSSLGTVYFFPTPN